MDGTQVAVPMMEQVNSFAYYQGTNFEAVSLPYGGGRLSMLLVLPNTGVDVGTLAASITPAAIESWLSQMTTGQVNIELPRFTTTFATSLLPALTALGMGDVFDATQNGLSGVYPGFVVNVARHQTYVEVDETGTVAAAATGVVGTTAAPASVNLLFTHPFFYAIRDNQTGELLFIGVMMNPGAG
jgi:serpin B